MRYEVLLKGELRAGLSQEYPVFHLRGRGEYRPSLSAHLPVLRALGSALGDYRSHLFYPKSEQTTMSVDRLDNSK